MFVCTHCLEWKETNCLLIFGSHGTSGGGGPPDDYYDYMCIQDYDYNNKWWLG